MAGTKEGARKVKEQLLADNPNYYKEIGAKGGAAKVSKGFGKMHPEDRIEAGRKGGQTSRRKATKDPQEANQSTQE
jgi:general stress protein YciG